MHNFTTEWTDEQYTRFADTDWEAYVDGEIQRLEAEEMLEQGFICVD